MIKKFSSPKMRNRQFVFAPKIEYELVAERSEANQNRLIFPFWCSQQDASLSHSSETHGFPNPSSMGEVSSPDPSPVRFLPTNTKVQNKSALLYWCSQQESNLHLVLRTDLLYPLSYESDLSNISRNLKKALVLL